VVVVVTTNLIAGHVPARTENDTRVEASRDRRLVEDQETANTPPMGKLKGWWSLCGRESLFFSRRYSILALQKIIKNA
jgi:hypothetical protein